MLLTYFLHCAKQKEMTWNAYLNTKLSRLWYLSKPGIHVIYKHQRRSNRRRELLASKISLNTEWLLQLLSSVNHNLGAVKIIIRLFFWFFCCFLVFLFLFLFLFTYIVTKDLWIKRYTFGPLVWYFVSFVTVQYYFRFE